MKVLTSMTFSVVLLLADSSVEISTQNTQPTPEIAIERTQIDRYPTHEVLFGNGVRSLPDIVYSSPGGYRPLTLDLYLPPSTLKKPATGFPLVVQIHGGGQMRGDKRFTAPFGDWPSVLASLAAKGYVVAAVNYRLSSEAKFPAQIQDVKSAMKWLRVNRTTQGFDPARVATWGASAGGHLAALAGVSCGVKALQPEGVAKPGEDATASSKCVQAVTTWYGVFDLTTIQAQARETSTLPRETADAPEWKLVGCFAGECKPGQFAAASPISYLDAKDPQMLLIVGDADLVVPPKQTLEMAERLTQVGVKHELIVLPGVDHSFTAKTERQTREANLKALTATFQFFDRTIGRQ